jgi:Zn-dependent protease with chaperone function
MLVQIILIIIGFIIALSYPIGIEPLLFLPVDSGSSFVSTITILLLSTLYVLLGINLVKKCLHSMSYLLRDYSGNGNSSNSNDSGQPLNERNYFCLTLETEYRIQQNLSSYYRCLSSYRLLLLLVYFIQVYILHLPVLIKNMLNGIGLDSGEIPFLTNLLVLMPFILTLLISYIPFYWMERFINGIHCLVNNELDVAFPKLAAYLSFQIRTYFLIALLPLLIFTLIFDLFSMIPFLQHLMIIYPFVEWVLSLLLILLMYILAPFVLKYLWITESLPGGSLRLLLESIANRAQVKVKDFLVWKVGRRPFANALLIGLFPFNRFVIFTDTVLRKLSDDEIASVFAHEIGHAKFKHLAILLIFSCVYMSVLFSMNGLMNETLGSGIWNFGFSISVLLIFWLVLFGRLSRRFEIQADWFASEITANPDSFINALSKIAYLNGVPVKTSGLSSLTHPSIEKRISHIKNKISSSFSELILIRKIVIILIISCVIGLGGVSYTIITQLYSVPERMLELKADELAQKADTLMIMGKNNISKKADIRASALEQAIFDLNGAIKLDPGRSAYYIMLGDAYTFLDGDGSVLSTQAYEKAYSLQPADPLERYYLSKKLTR